MEHNKYRLQKINSKKARHRSSKDWVIIPMSLLMFMGIKATSLHTDTYASQINNNQTNSVTNTTKFLSNRQLIRPYVQNSVNNDTEYNKGPEVITPQMVMRQAVILHERIINNSLATHRQRNVGALMLTRGNNYGKEAMRLTPQQEAEKYPNETYAKEFPQTVNSKYRQNYHYSNPMGQSNDLEGILPAYKDGKIDHYDIYYLWNPVGGVGENEWGHVTTNDFRTFHPADPSDALSVKNVAIPNPQYIVNGVSRVDVDQSDKSPIPWTYPVGGSVISNRRPHGGQWLTKDQWGNYVSPGARIAYFESFGPVTGIFMAYANPDGNGGYHQFRPYDSHQIMFVRETYDYRDPSVTTAPNGNLVAYVAGGGTGNVFQLTSTDGVRWKEIAPVNLTRIMSRFDTDLTKSGGLCIETPHVFTLGGQPMMLVSIRNQMDNRNQGMYYITGRLGADGSFHVTPNSKMGSLDNGLDNYAGNYVKLGNNKLIYIGWLGNWYSFDGIHNSGFSLARTVSWNGEQLESTPILPGALVKNDLVRGQKNEYQSKGRLDISFDHPLSRFKIQLQRPDDNKITFAFNRGKVTISRQGSVFEMNDAHTSSVDTDVLNRVQFYLDNGSVEIYLPDVHQVYSLLDFGNVRNAPYKLISVPDKAKVTSYLIDLNSHPVVTDTVNFINASNKKYIGNIKVAGVQGDDYVINDRQIPRGYQLVDPGSSKLKLDGGIHDVRIRLRTSDVWHDKWGTANVTINKKTDTITISDGTVGDLDSPDQNAAFFNNVYDIENGHDDSSTDKRPVRSLPNNNLDWVIDVGKNVKLPSDGNASELFKGSPGNGMPPYSFSNQIKAIRFLNPLMGIKSSREMFTNLLNLQEIDGLNNLDTANDTDMAYMFADNPKLINLRFS